MAESITVTDIYSISKVTKISSVSDTTRFKTETLRGKKGSSKNSYAVARIDVDINKLNQKIVYGTLNSIKVNCRAYCNVNEGGWEAPTIKLGYIDSGGGETWSQTWSQSVGREQGGESGAPSFSYNFAASCKSNNGSYQFLIHIQNEIPYAILSWAKVFDISLTLNYEPHTCNFSIESSRVDAKCTTEGSVTKKCSVSGCDKTQTSKLPATGHNSNTIIPAVAATCISTGLTEGKKCSTCGTVTVAQSTTSALGHAYANPKYSWASNGTSCSVTGTCSRSGCGATTTERGTITSTTKTAATCLNSGIKTYTAKFNASWATTQTKDVAIPATGHSFGSTTAAKPATCLSAGNNAYKKCSNCGLFFSSSATTTATGGSSDTKSFVINALNHSYTGAVKSDGNGKDATHSFKCVNGCDSYGNATKHTWNSGKVTTNPTCVTAGEFTYTCTVDNCGGTYVESIPTIEHSWVDATCTTPKTCSVCSLTEGSALGHDYNIEKKDPTNSSLGCTIYTCKRDGCGYSYVDDITCLITVNCDTTMGYVSGSGVYATGTSITIEATANSGYKFVGWSDGSTENIRTFSADNSMTYTAIFATDKLYLGTLKPSKIFIDDKEVKAIYIDTTKVYG